MTLLSHFLAFAITLAALLALSRWINRHVQLLGLHISGDHNVAITAYFLLMFPGILLHELSHYLVAKLLGLRVGKFAIGPRRRQHYVELGSVSIASGGPVRDSLVGLAPFIAGTAVLLLVSFLAFDVAAFGEAWAADGWRGMLTALDGIWRVPDFWLWGYVIFVVSNAMTPSPSDRQPWLIASIYLAGALALVYLLGGLSLLTEALRPSLTGGLQALTLGFLFSVGVNLVVAAVLAIAETVVVEVKK